MPALVVCPHCNVHAKRSELRCPHCGGALNSGRPAALATAASVLLGLSLGACTSKKPPPRQQEAKTAGEVEHTEEKAEDEKAEEQPPPPPVPEPEYGLPEFDPPKPAYGFAQPLLDDPPPSDRER